MILLFLSTVLISIGLFFIIIYLNLFTVGYSFLEFGKFIIKEPVFWLFLVGLFMAWKVIKNELFLRYTFKHGRRK